MKREILRLVLLVFVALFGGPALADDRPGDGSFQVRRGVNIAGPLMIVRKAPGADGGPISHYYGIIDFVTLREKSAKKSGIVEYQTGKEVAAGGYDFVRLLVTPLPLLENPPTAQAVLRAEIKAGIEHYREHGLRVVLALMLHPNYQQPQWDAHEIIAAKETEQFTRYRAMVRELAVELDPLPQGSVALELFNDPPLRLCESSGWMARQETLYTDVRSVSKRLPLIVTGCDYGIDGLLDFSATKRYAADKNVLFNFHFYEPMYFTHQGSSLAEYKPVEGVLFPTAVSDKAEVIATTKKNLAGGSPTSFFGAKNDKVIDLLQKFLDTDFDTSNITRKFDALRGWAAKNGIESSRLFLGEFAALNWRRHDSPSYRESRVRWDRDVIASAERLGIGWAYLNLAVPNGDPLGAKGELSSP